MLRSYAHKNQKNWDRYLQVVAHAYRTTVNSATGYSPFRALYDREARQPSGSWIEDFASNNYININEYAQLLAHALHYGWQEISATMSRKERKLDAVPPPANSRAYVEYEPNETFYLKSIPKRFFTSDDGDKIKITAKLQARYTGPHRVIVQKNPITFIAEVNGKLKTVHANKMKRDTPFTETVREVVIVDDEDTAEEVCTTPSNDQNLPGQVNVDTDVDQFLERIQHQLSSSRLDTIQEASNEDEDDSIFEHTEVNSDDDDIIPIGEHVRRVIYPGGSVSIQRKKRKTVLSSNQGGIII